MSAGFLVSVVKSPNITKTRLLRRERAVKNFLKMHVKPADSPSVTVQVFNSNGYLSHVVVNEEAIKEFA